jgi:CHAT domain-containing protein
MVVVCVLLLSGTAAAQAPADRPPGARELAVEDARRVKELQKQIAELRRAGKVAEARAALQQVLDIRRRTRPAGHWEIADAEHRLRTLERTAALPAEAQAELAAVKRRGVEINQLEQQGRIAEAVPLQEKALEVCRRHLGDDDLDVVSATYNLARLLVLGGRPADAERVAREAVRASLRVFGDGHPLTAMCHDALTRALDDQGRYGEAGPFAEKALAIVRAAYGADAPETAIACTNAGGSRVRRGDLAGAEALYRRALEIRRRRLGEDHPATAQSYDNVAAVLSRRGRSPEIEPLLRKALAIRRRARGEGHRETGQSYGNLAAYLALEARYAEAEPLARRAVEIVRAVGGPAHLETAWAESVLADILSHQGRSAEAEALLRRALEVHRQKLGDDHPRTASSYRGLALELMTQGRDAEAEPFARRAVEIRRQRLGEDHPDTAEALDTLAAVLQVQENYAAAEPLHRQALAVRRAKLGEGHPDTVQTLFNMAMSLASQGRFAEAEPLVRQAVELRRAALGEGHPQTVRALGALADILQLQGRYDEAADAGRAAARGFEAIRLRVGFAGLERVSFAGARSCPLPGLVCCLAHTGRAVEAWQYREAGLARGLLDEVAAREARPLDAAERQRERDLLDRLDRLDRRLAEPPGPGADAAPAAALRRDRDTLLAELTRFEAELAERHGVAAGQVYDLGRVQRQLAEDEALVGWIEFMPGRAMKSAPDGCWACVVRRTGPPVWVRLPGTGPAGAWTEDDFRLVERLRAALAHPADAADLARRLYAQRLTPLETILRGADNLPPVRRLIVLPSGWTAGVPVEAVTDRYAVSYAPSATLFVWLREKRRPGAAPGAATLLAVGDPAFGPAGVAVAARRGGTGAVLPPLPGTRYEVEAIAGLFPRADTLLGSDASEQRLAELAGAGSLRGYRFVHLATHAVVDAQRPLQSALVLAQDRLPEPAEQAPAGGRVFQGRLTAGDVLRTWRLDADLVVLSACDTGLGRPGGGEGYLGFAQPLFLAGARGLVMSLWKVDDTATALLMRRFYEDLLGKRAGLERLLPKAEALREAKAWLRGLTAEEARRLAADLPGGGRGTERARPRDDRPAPARPFEHPHYWAAFILVGDPD